MADRNGRTKGLDNLLSDPKRAIISMAAPLFLSMLVGNLQSFIDSVWCSGLGSDELSAISISSPVYMLIIAVGSGIGLGASSAIARFLGGNDRASAEKTLNTTIVLILIVSIASSVVMWFLAEPLIRFCGGGNNIDLCMEYTRPFLFLSFFLMMNGVLAGTLRAEGASRTSMALSMTASLINMVLDPVMIYVLDMGVTGASVATCISFIAITAIGLRLYTAGRTYLSLNLKGFRFERPVLHEIGLVGIPCSIEMILSPLLIIPEQALVVSCGGSDGLVVYVNAFRFISLALIPASAISKSLLPILSASIGQQDMPKIRESIRLTYRIVLALETSLAIVIFLSAEALVSLFMNSDSMEELRDELVLATRIYSITCIFNSVQGVGMSVLQSSRHAFLATAMTFVRELMFLTAFFIASGISMHAIYWSLDAVNLCMMCIMITLSGYAVKLIEKDLRAEATSQAS